MKNKNMLKTKYIPNKQIQIMFYRVASASQIVKFEALANRKNPGLATAYASKIVTKEFFNMRDDVENLVMQEAEVSATYDVDKFLSKEYGRL